MATDTAGISSFYDQNPGLEHARLQENPVEYAVTLAVILQTLEKIQGSSQTPCRILDLGGATGRYAVELAKLGHKVVLSDISAAELDIAKEHAAANKVRLEAIVTADARDVRKYAELFKPDHYDIVLCMGPFYHLLAEEERLQLLKDCLEMTKPSGFVIPAFVTVYAHLRDVAKKDPKRLITDKDFYAGYFETGQYTRTVFAMHHTTAKEIRKLFAKVKDTAEIRRLVGTESFLVGRMASELTGLSKEEFQAWADVTLKYAEDPEAAGAADHILIVAEKL